MSKILSRSRFSINLIGKTSALTSTQPLSGQLTPLQWRRALFRRQRLRRHYGDSVTSEFLNNTKLFSYDLPVDTQNSELVWSALCDNVHFHKEVFDYAVDLKQRTGQVFGKLYYYMLKSILLDPNHQTSHALHIHKLFQTHYVITKNSIISLAPLVLKNSRASDTFKLIYQRCQGLPMQIYDKIVPELFRRGAWIQALEWHQSLSANGDRCQSSNSLDDIAEARPDLIPFLMQYDVPSPPSTYAATALSPTPSSQSPPSASADTALNDHIVARLFATKSLSLKFIISGLKMVEAPRLGPMALRELLLRAKSCQDATGYLQMLEDAKIDMEKSNYCIVLLHFIKIDNFELLHNTLASDLHPDTFDEVALQHRLLFSYGQAGDTVALNRTQAILEILSSSNYTEKEDHAATALNPLFRASDINLLAQHLHDMISSSEVKHREIDTTMTALLSRHNYRSKSMPENSALIMTLNTCILAYDSGYEVSHQHVTKLCSRLNHSSKLDTIWKFLTHVFKFFAPPNFGQNMSSGFQLQRSLYQDLRFTASLSAELPVGHPQNYLHQILSSEFFSNIMTLGAKHGCTHIARENGQGTATSFFLSIRLIDRLRDLGLRTPVEELSVIFLDCIWMLSTKNLFGGISFAREVNTWTVEELVVAAMGVWKGPPLFPALWELSPLTNMVSTEPLVYKSKLMPSVLTGLLPHTHTSSRHLPHDMRLRNRIKLRQALFSAYRVDPRDRYTPEEFDEWLKSDALSADRAIFSKFGLEWDKYPREKLEEQYSVLEASPQIALVKQEN